MFADFLVTHIARALPHESEDALQIPEYLLAVKPVCLVSLTTVSEPPLGPAFVTFTEAISR